MTFETLGNLNKLLNSSGLNRPKLTVIPVFAVDFFLTNALKLGDTANAKSICLFMIYRPEGETRSDRTASPCNGRKITAEKKCTASSMPSYQNVHLVTSSTGRASL